MRIELHPAARRELQLAVDWYIAEAGKPTAARFIAEFEHLQALIRENPDVGAPGKPGSRRFIFRHFPYTLAYRTRGDLIEILALAHHSRQPDYWMGRA